MIKFLAEKELIADYANLEFLEELEKSISFFANLLKKKGYVYILKSSSNNNMRKNFKDIISRII